MGIPMTAIMGIMFAMSMIVMGMAGMRRHTHEQGSQKGEHKSLQECNKEFQTAKCNTNANTSNTHRWM